MFKKIVFIIIILLILGVSIFSYLNYQSPEEIIGQAFDNLVNAKSYEYEGEMKLTVNMKEASTVQGVPFFNIKENSIISMNFNGKYSSTEEELHSLELDINADLIEGMNISMEVEIVLTLDKAFFRLKKAPNLGFISFEFLEGKWIEFELNGGDLQEDKMFLDYLEMINDIERGKDVKISGKSGYNYSFNIDKDLLFQSFLDIVLGEVELTREDLKEMNLAKDAIKEIRGEYVIGKSDNFPYRFSLDIATGEIENLESTKFEYHIYFNNFNQPVEIKIPEGITFDEVEDFFPY